MKKNVIKLNEKDLRNLISEGVRRVINEISLDTLRSARNKFDKVYGPQLQMYADEAGTKPMQMPDVWNGGGYFDWKPSDRKPKDGRSYDEHMKDFDDAISRGEIEQINSMPENEFRREAINLFWDKQFDGYRPKYKNDWESGGSIHLSTQGWTFDSDDAWPEYDETLDDHVLKFTTLTCVAPGGRSCSFSGEDFEDED